MENIVIKQKHVVLVGIIFGITLAIAAGVLWLLFIGIKIWSTVVIAIVLTGLCAWVFSLIDRYRALIGKS